MESVFSIGCFVLRKSSYTVPACVSVFRKKEGAKRVRYTITVLHQGTPVRVSAIASTSKAAKAAAAKAVLEKIGKT